MAKEYLTKSLHHRKKLELHEGPTMMLFFKIGDFLNGVSSLFLNN